MTRRSHSILSDERLINGILGLITSPGFEEMRVLICFTLLFSLPSFTNRLSQERSGTHKRARRNYTREQPILRICVSHLLFSGYPAPELSKRVSQFIHPRASPRPSLSSRYSSCRSQQLTGVIARGARSVSQVYSLLDRLAESASNCIDKNEIICTCENLMNSTALLQGMDCKKIKNKNTGQWISIVLVKHIQSIADNCMGQDYFYYCCLGNSYALWIIDHTKGDRKLPSFVI